MAIDDICPKDGKDLSINIPALKSESDIEKHVDVLENNLNAKFLESAD
tara:strand:+ start:1134 stop:1277 length:144 start_codon:yes stop_codon:yes gene_type:complete